jgi:hypothetical protein
VYQLYEARGKKDGHELEDWFRAKEELTIKKFRTAPAWFMHTSKQKTTRAPDPSGAFFMHTRDSSIISIADQSPAEYYLEGRV